MLSATDPGNLPLSKRSCLGQQRFAQIAEEGSLGREVIHRPDQFERSFITLNGQGSFSNRIKRPKAASLAAIQAQARRRCWRLRRRCGRSKRRWRASSAKMIEVRGERTGTGAGDCSDGGLAVEASFLMVSIR